MVPPGMTRAAHGARAPGLRPMRPLPPTEP